MRQDPLIEIPGGLRWTAERRSTHSIEWQNQLLSAKVAGDPCLCLCTDKGTRPLYVTTRKGMFYLARHPGTGHLHRSDCRFYSPAPEESGLAIYTESALRETGDGRKIVQLSVPLARRLNARQPAAEGVGSFQFNVANTCARMTPLGLLNFLWAEADLARWYPNMAGKRTWASVRKALLTAGSQITSRKRSIEDKLIVVPAEAWPALSDDVWRDIVEKANRPAGGTWIEHFLLLGEVKTIRPGPRATVVGLAATPSRPLTLFATHALEAAWRRSYPFLDKLGADASPPRRVVGLLFGDLRADGARVISNIHAGAFLPMTAEFIPYASSYEHRVARRLIDQGRAFQKPLRYEAGADVVFPDFVLLDTELPHYPMEVYGRMNDPAYVARRQQKNLLYQKLYGAAHFWQWVVDPAYPDAIPPFPPKGR